MRPRASNPRHLLTSIILSSAGKVFLVSLSCWLLSFTYCKFRYWRDPHSAFFNSDHVYDLKYTSFREAQANALIRYAAQPSANLKKASSNPEICVVWTTLQRNGKNYIDPAIASMLEGLTDEERAKILVHAFFVNTDPTVHDSWNATWLRKGVDHVWSYDIDNETMAHLQALEEARDFREKGVFDYVYALDACLNSTAPYIAVFEGDIILADGWLVKTLKALRDIELCALDGGKYWNWIYLRLFYTETPLMWGADDFWYQNLYLTLVLASFAGYTIFIGFRLVAPSSRKLLDNYAIAVLCVITIPAFTILVFMIGKTSLFPPGEVFLFNKLGCCSQALLFPREQVPDLMQFLKKEKAGQTDMIIEDYADQRHKQRLALGRQVAQHVGTVSSRDNNVANTRSVWAFFFEEYDPEKLRKEHDELLSIIS